MLKWILAIVCILIWFILLFLFRKKISELIIGMLSGAVCLIAFYFLGNMLGVYININFFTTLVSITLGLPGITLLVICGFLC